MLKNFICPDGLKQEAAVCLQGHCRMEQRCAPITFLALAGRERVWKGVPSVTQLIDGTRRQYFMLTTYHDLNPAKAAYRVLGTRGHTALDADNDLSFAEEHFDDGEIQGTADMVEKQENGEWWLIDHKTSGSYKVAKAIGLVKKSEVLLDEFGVALKHKNGKVKQKTWYEIDESSRDIKDWALQLNKYRIMAEKALSEKISRIKIFAIVRDGNTFSAKNRGVDREIYYIDIPIIKDVDVIEYFRVKRLALLNALEFKVIPPECSPEECWDGKKCELCEVADECFKAGRSYTVEGEDE